MQLEPTNIITAERLRELLSYDPETGVFTWAKKQWGKKTPMGSPVGTAKGGRHPYIVIWLEGRLYRAHRLAWLHVHGRWPAQVLDHINGNCADNRLGNLREATEQQNKGNLHALNPRNTSGYRGVTWKRDKRKWKAYINRDNRQCHLGYFDTPEAAYAAYKVAAVAHFGEFARV